VAIGAKETYLGTYAWRYTTGLHDVLSTSLLFNKILKKRYYGQNYFENKAWARVDIIPGCFMLVKSHEMKEYGLYDEDFFLYEEEKVFFRKMTSVGFCLAIDLDTSFEHHHVDHKLTVQQCLVTKRRLVDSKRKFLLKYRHFNPIEIMLSNVFFGYCYIEMFLYASTKQVVNSIKNGRC
jgi:GT2 family glycosyltransferase